jgi:hypothetical protein
MSERGPRQHLTQAEYDVKYQRRLYYARDRGSEIARCKRAMRRRLRYERRCVARVAAFLMATYE